MSTSSLPSYAAPSFAQTPTYSAEPRQSERRIALVDRLRARPTGHFVKKSKNGDAQLRLAGQEDNSDIDFPIFGAQSRIDGLVELFKPDNVTSVDVKIEGRLLLKEIAEGGSTYVKSCLASDTLWRKESVNGVCPRTLSFSLSLPATLTHEDKTYHDESLSASSTDIQRKTLRPTWVYRDSRSSTFPHPIAFAIKVSCFGKLCVNFPNTLVVYILIYNVDTRTISTPFKYRPRSRPATPLPSPLIASRHGFIESPEWTCHQCEIRPKTREIQPVKIKLYLPTSRIFCKSQLIPFHLTFESSSQSLTSFLPYCPTAGFIRRKQATSIQLMRQSTVDVRNAVISGTKTDMWRIDCIGEGVFRHTADGPTWTAFSGEIKISDTVTVTGFKVAGLNVKDCILLSMTPPDPQRSPFADLRQLIPVKLTTDAWTADGTGVGALYHRSGSEYSLASVLASTEETVHGALEGQRSMQEVAEVADPQTHQGRTKLHSEMEPSPSVARSQTPPQQAATSPESGSEVQASQAQVPFKERVIGVAKPSLKEEGEKIIQGQLTSEQTKGGA
ncbi:hypothetical protein H0H92_009514 [Tricholoma furcatifolium]|nr:hypothetical protein H0H92_009514 [Tricholoma furcatifolium]